MARDMISKGSTEAIEKTFTLGASLGQCYGGVVQLRFEKLTDISGSGELISGICVRECF